MPWYSSTVLVEMVVVTLVVSFCCTQVAVVVTVRQALQDTRAVERLSINNANRKIFFIFSVFIDLTLDGRECVGGDEYASGGVLGYGAHMDADTGAFGYVTYLGHELFEARRPRAAEGVRACRDDVVGILEGGTTDGVGSVCDIDVTVNTVGLAMGAY